METRSIWGRVELFDGHRNRVVEIDGFRLTAEVQDAFVPRLVARLSAVLHEIARDAVRVVGVHAQTAVRCGVAEALDVARAMDVVGRLAEKDLHELHRIGACTGFLRLLVLRPIAVGWNPRRVPHDATDQVVTSRRGISWLTDGDGIRLD